MSRTQPGIPERFFSHISEVPPLLQQSYLPSLDGLRAVSIIIVLVYHVLLKLKIETFHGAFGVDVFFVISGFIITTLLLKEKVNKNNISLRKFYIRRFLKILPIAYLYLAVVSLLNTHYHNLAANEILAAALFLKNTHLLNNFVNTPPGHFWSLSVEEQFYIVFPFILKKSTGGYFYIILTLLFLVPLALILENKGIGIFAGDGARNFLDFFRHIIPIMVGALSSLLIFKKVITKRIYPNGLVSNISLLVLAYILYAGIRLPHFTLYTKWLCPPVVALIIVNNIFSSKDLFFKLLNSKIMVKVGLASYSIYIWQQLFLLEAPWTEDLEFTASPWFGLPAALLAGFCSYFFLERTLAKYKSRFR